MKGSIAVLGQVNDQSISALIVEGQLSDVLVDPVDPSQPVPEAIYRAVVDRQVKGQGGVFLRLPGGNAFLKQAKGLAPGQQIVVQVTGHAEDGKATPVTAKLLFKGRHAIVTPLAPGLNISRSIRNDDERDRLMLIAKEQMQGSDYGLIIRSAAADETDDTIAQDVETQLNIASQIMTDAAQDGPELLWDGPDAHHLAWREWAKPDRIDSDDHAWENNDVQDLLDVFLQAKVTLTGQTHMFVEPTRALIAIDVNTGGDTSPAAGLKANIAAARDLPRQLRIRGLGGQITIDFAPMPKKDRRQLETVLRSAFKADATETALVGWTPLGHFELQRKRDRLPLAEMLSQ